jgi:hypothetical protein
VSPRALECSLRSCVALRYIADYRRAADLRIGAVRERRTTDRRVSVRAASNRAASAVKPGVGPFQRNWSIWSKSAMSVRRVASVRKSSARSRSRNRVAARVLALGRRRLRAPAWQSRIAIGRIADQRQIVGDRCGRDAELLEYTGLI